MAKQGSSANVLVTGGAGYIGAHAVWHLRESGYQVTVLDNLSRGHEETVQRLQVPFVKGEIDDLAALARVCEIAVPDVVMHFAAFACVGESVSDPALYYRNNVQATLGMLQGLRRYNVNKVIFSSTCATYGIPAEVPITEDCPQKPINPYGHSKLMMEQILRDFETAYGFRSIFFRYFNAAGALASGLIGERHEPETHLLPLTVMAALDGPELKIFGDDYATPDGTCIRDYIHASDLAAAHILGLEHLLRGGQSGAYNIGTGLGNSVNEVIRAVEEVSGRKVRFSMGPRRPGDPPVLVAGAEKIRRELGWKPEYTDIRKIVETAWKWHSR